VARQTICCPFCFRDFALIRVAFRCRNPHCKLEDDPIYTKARGWTRSTPMHRSFVPAHGGGFLSGYFGVQKSTCDACGEETTKRLCPHCHFELSYETGKIDDHSIAIIGARGAGKGHYITTLVRQLENDIGGRFGFSLNLMGDESRRRFEEDYRAPLSRGELLAPTQSALTDSAVKAPIVFRLTFSRNRHAVNLSIFDSAGEDMQSLDTMSAEARYICSAKGIVFLLDPLQIDAVRQRLAGASLPARDPKADPVYIVERLRELFEMQNGVKPGEKVRSPIAFALSKIDALYPIVDAGSALRSYGHHAAKFNTRDSQSVDTEVRSYLESWLGPRLTQRVDAAFADYRYFGISALGQPPSAKGQVESVDSVRVEDPFLWLLFRLGLIKGSR
jgi:hypothetical protein